MNQMTLARRMFVQDQKGADMVEYIIAVGVIALVAILGFRTFGASVRGKILAQSQSVQGID